MECLQPGPGADERSLIIAAQRDRTAFAVLYERHLSRIYQYCLCRTGSQVDAEEVTAQTFLRALEYLGRYKWTGAPFVVWLYRIADSVILKSRRRPPAGPLPADLAGPPLPGLEEEELRQDLLRELYRLPQEHQQVLILRFGQELSYDEIAAVVDRTPGALRQLVFRSLQTLRERMGRA
ncbi:MAG TPA: RNA polymerase sigma factor [Symbiobacteriaceae bacterium]|nr:RNA polymerase sigma factor [Symbiobacteriaceae bacterium]